MTLWLKDECPAEAILARLDALRSKTTTTPSLASLNATTYREGEATVIAFEAGTCLVLPPPVAAPWPLTDGFAFEPPPSFGAAMAIANGMELSYFDPGSLPERSGEVTRKHTRFFAGAGREAVESWRDDWLAPILDEPEEYGFDDEALARHEPSDFMVVYDDANGTFGGFHRQIAGPSGEPAFVLWMHDEPGGFYGRSLARADTLTHGDYLVALVYAHATDSDAYDLLFRG
ncbi:hypothetical protein DB30_05202 [Enhygromyxa salina]|uniref:Uncharacterized protein n=1 Tax=Enhygromyxa salina TaxID=215803 RepID=A0A0C1ZDR8_9BACT|nr:hypothetical protein [Enhygromyxa salina]KIG15784.1 hypothetical protein DB30_05202 [Enhygromyxa salina]